MLKRINPWAFLTFLGFLAVLWASPALSSEAPVSKKESQEQTAAPKLIPPPQQKEGIDILFVLDCSGSMKKTDPLDLRKPATQLIVSLLGAKDRIGLIGFGGQAQTLVPLTENLPDNQKIFFQALQKNIGSQELFTNLYDALKKGYEEMRGSKRSNKILLFISDGQMDLGSKEQDETAQKALSRLLPELVKDKIKLYTVAFTELSDKRLLSDLAEKTQGFFQLAKTDKDLHIIFSSIFEQVTLPDTVPLEGDSFLIDKEVQEATILITKQPETTTRLMDPNRKDWAYGRLPENILWQQTNAFDLITIKKPFPGRWKVQLSTKEGNKIFVITDLALKSSLIQNQVFQGQEILIEAWLEKNQKRLTEKKFLESIFFLVDITDPNGNHTRISLYPSKAGEDSDKKGVYSTPFSFKLLGDYKIKITLDGKVYKRELVRQVKVLSQTGPSSAASRSYPVEQKAAHSDTGGIWVRAIIRLGLVNAGLLVMVMLFYAAKRWKRKPSPKKEKKKKKA